MLALMLYAEARRAARRSADGAYVPLDDQDTALWDHELITAAESLLRQASSTGATGRYQLEAAIQSAHVARLASGAETWPAIAALYDHLYGLTQSPVVILNRAAARAEIDGPATALVDLDSLAADPRMADYQPYWAARGHLAARAGRKDLAFEAFTRAIGLSTDDAVRHYLHTQLAALRDG